MHMPVTQLLSFDLESFKRNWPSLLCNDSEFGIARNYWPMSGGSSHSRNCYSHTLARRHYAKCLALKKSERLWTATNKTSEIHSNLSEKRKLFRNSFDLCWNPKPLNSSTTITSTALLFERSSPRKMRGRNLSLQFVNPVFQGTNAVAENIEVAGDIVPKLPRADPTQHDDSVRRIRLHIRGCNVLGCEHQLKIFCLTFAPCLQRNLVGNVQDLGGERDLTGGIREEAQVAHRSPSQGVQELPHLISRIYLDTKISGPARLRWRIPRRSQHG